MVEVIAAQSFATYIAGDLVSAVGGKPVRLPKDRVKDLQKAGLVLAEGEEPEAVRNEAVPSARILSDLMPNPDDITAEEELLLRQDPSLRSKVVDGKPVIVDPDEVAAPEYTEDGRPDEGTMDPADEGIAARGSHTTGREDLGKGPKPASKPVETGQGNAKRKPAVHGRRGKPDTEAAPDPIETVGTKEPKVPTGPREEEPHPSPGTVG
jgi:hypothetical protein